MKFLVSLCLAAPIAFAQNMAPQWEDPAWLKSTADSLAGCVGTLRGAAQIARGAGQQESATYLEGLARGALVASQFLLTTRADLRGTILYAEDSAAYVERVAHGTEGRFKMLSEQATEDSRSEMASAMQVCVEVNEVQSAIIRAFRESQLDGSAPPRGNDEPSPR